MLCVMGESKHMMLVACGLMLVVVGFVFNGDVSRTISYGLPVAGIAMMALSAGTLLKG